MTAKTQHVGKRFLISGVVQGVGFRYSMARRANALGLSGWCRNVETGQVEAEAFGPPEQIKRLEDWCYEGPPHAAVSYVELTDLTLYEARTQKGFIIIR